MNPPREISELIDVTLCFLAKREDGKYSELCLAEKKRGFGKGKWNGVGGKVETGVDESIEAGAIREAQEEIGVDILSLEKVGELAFFFINQPEDDMLVHVYFTEEWEKEPIESEEMRPEWYSVHDIPYSEMWADDELWLPKVLDGERVKAWFSFDDPETIAEYHMSDLHR